MREILLVSIGGFIGAISRFIISKQMQERNKTGFPIGTLTVNLLGAFLLGLLLGLNVKAELYTLLGTGFMGAFTTFSTLKLEAEQLRKSQKKRHFIIYLLSSYILGIILAFCGHLIGRAI